MICMLWYLKDVVPKGEMTLYGAAVVFVEYPKIDKPNCIEISTPQRSLFLCTDTKKELRVSFMLIIIWISYEYRCCVLLVVG